MEKSRFCPRNGRTASQKFRAGPDNGTKSSTKFFGGLASRSSTENGRMLSQMAQVERKRFIGVFG